MQSIARKFLVSSACLLLYIGVQGCTISVTGFIEKTVSDESKARLSFELKRDLK